MAPIRVTWAQNLETSLGIRITYPNGLIDVTSADDLLNTLPKGSEVHGYYRDGPYLLGRLVDMRDRGHISKIVVRPYIGSHPYVRTTLSGVAELTARLWVSRTPEALIIHPVFNRLHPYLPYGMTAALADLITTIFDPRWYNTSCNRPNRWSRLEQAFALSPRGDRVGCPRRAVVRACWTAPDEPPAADNHPADFFGRTHAGLLATGYSEEAAVRKTGRKLIRAVVAAWLDDEVAGGDPLFEPSRLFDPAAVDATKL